MLFPPHHLEIENIFTQVQAENHRSIAITSANPGEGVTSIALALAQRNLLSGNSSLIIDMNLTRPSLQSVLSIQKLDDTASSLDTPQLVSNQSNEISLMGITAPQDRSTIMKLRQPGVLETCLEACKEKYELVIIDTSPLNDSDENSIPAARIAAACNATLIVVLAGHTREISVHTAVQRLKTSGANLMGCIINDKNNPPLQSELIREAKRLEPFLSRISKRIQRSISRSHFLSLVD